MADTVEQLALDLALNRVGQLERALSDLRARALEQAGPTVINGLGLGVFCVSIAASACVLVPKASVVLALSEHGILEVAEVEQLDLPAVVDRVARRLDFFAAESRQTFRRLTVASRLATISLVVEVILWSVETIVA